MMAFLILLPIFMVAVTVHEVSHGWVAWRLGDPTAKRLGRLTLNPLKHLDPIGTVALPLLLILVHAPFVFGWARPVPINPLAFARPRQALLWIGLAGPAANFALAIAAAGLLSWARMGWPDWLVFGLQYLILLNLVLGMFNLLPIPPLDGSRILTGLLPLPYARWLFLLERWGVLLILLLLYLGVIDRWLWPSVLSLARWLGVR
jgi:Zn-dependent protease